MAGSETDALRSGRVLKREHVGESNMWHVRTADDHKVPLPNELLYTYFTDRLGEAGKVLVSCSQNINATHFSSCVCCNSKHVCMLVFLALSIYIYTCICAYIYIYINIVCTVSMLWIMHKIIKWTQLYQKLHSQQDGKLWGQPIMRANSCIIVLWWKIKGNMSWVQCVNFKMNK